MTCTIYRVDTGAPFIANATIVTNSDGSVSFELVDGTFAGQYPDIYGQRADQAPNTGAPQAYQRATLNGGIVTFVTRPGDLPCGYLCAQGQAYVV